MATQTPLRILVLPPVDGWGDEIQALKEAGHTVYAAAHALTVPDLILGRAAWHMTEELRPYIKQAVAEAQRRLRAAKPRTPKKGVARGQGT